MNRELLLQPHKIYTCTFDLALILFDFKEESANKQTREFYQRKSSNSNSHSLTVIMAIKQRDTYKYIL